MRSYIFTNRERQVIKAFLDGRAKSGEDIMRQVISRIRLFSNLEDDVDLYLKLREVLSAP